MAGVLRIREESGHRVLGGGGAGTHRQEGGQEVLGISSPVPGSHCELWDGLIWFAKLLIK